MNKDNIILVGMPAAGKSTIGVILAKILGYSFVDSDLVIQEVKGKLLSQLIEEFGNDGFVQIENEVNSSISTHKSIIATGGSVCYCEEAMKHFKEIGTVVYIKLDYKTVSKRLKNIKARGVVMKPGYTLRTLYDERTPLYEKYADIIVNCSGDSVEDSVERLIVELAKV